MDTEAHKRTWQPGNTSRTQAHQQTTVCNLPRRPNKLNSSETLGPFFAWDSSEGVPLCSPDSLDNFPKVLRTGRTRIKVFGFTHGATWQSWSILIYRESLHFICVGPLKGNPKFPLGHDSPIWTSRGFWNPFNRRQETKNAFNPPAPLTATEAPIFSPQGEPTSSPF